MSKEQNIKALKITGLILLLAAVSILIYKLATRGENQDGDNPYVKGKSKGKFSGVSSKNYSKTEIENMQLWLMDQAIAFGNSKVENRINETDGIDGKIGPGFRDALEEAIRVGWVKSIEDLYKKAN